MDGTVSYQQKTIKQMNMKNFLLGFLLFYNVKKAICKVYDALQVVWESFINYFILFRPSYPDKISRRPPLPKFSPKPLNRFAFCKAKKSRYEAKIDFPLRKS